KGIAACLLHFGKSLSVEAYPYTVMLVMHRGSFILTYGTESITIKTGDSAVIVRGTQVRIDAQPDSLRACCGSTQASGPDNPGLTALDRLAML
ncbi:cupin, partial [Pseudomonas syringae pv. tagetis]